MYTMGIACAPALKINNDTNKYTCMVSTYDLSKTKGETRSIFENVQFLGKSD